MKRTMKSRLERYLRYLREDSEVQKNMLAQKYELKEQEVKQVVSQKPVLVEQDVRQVFHGKPGLMKQQVKQVVTQKPCGDGRGHQAGGPGGGEGEEAGNL